MSSQYSLKQIGGGSNENKKAKMVKISFVSMCAAVAISLSSITASANVYMSCGYPRAGSGNTYVPYNSFSLHNTWQQPMQQSISAVNAMVNSTGVAFSPQSAGSCNNSITTSYSIESWYGLTTYSRSGSRITSFTITLNSRTIANACTNQSNFIRSVLTHEMGHVIWLDDNPGYNSIMNYNRDRNTMVSFTIQDIMAISQKYG